MSLLIDYFISDIRKNTDNEEFDNTVGYSDEEIVRFINDGIYYIHGKILAQHPDMGIEEYTISTTSGTEAYNIPVNAYLNAKISGVEWSSDSANSHYFPLRKISHKLRSPGLTGDPTAYSFKNGKIYLSPIPTNNSGTLRISYVQRPKTVNKRRGQIIATAQCTDSLSAPTYIYINYLDATNDPVELARETYFSVVDKYGNIKMSNVLLSSIGSSGTTADTTSYDAKLNIDSSTSFNSGDVIAQGYYIVPTAFATTHITVDDAVKRYARQYAEMVVLTRDSSVDSKEAANILALIEKEVLASYADHSEEVEYIPEINDSFNFLWY